MCGLLLSAWRQPRKIYVFSPQNFVAAWRVVNVSRIADGFLSEPSSLGCLMKCTVSRFCMSDFSLVLTFSTVISRVSGSK